MRVFIEDFDVGADPFLTPAEFLAHPDMVANDRVADIVDPGLGVIRELGPLVQMSQTPARIERSAPGLGEHRAEWSAPRLTVPAPVDVAEPRPPLSGFTILEVAYFIAGPLATAILAEMGARVVKVEPLDGDPYRRTGLQSAKFLHGKESVTLDLKHPDGRAILDTLLDRADVVVHSFRAAAAGKLGLDADTVLQRNPRAVHLYAASYGSRGPQRDRAAFHSTPNALTGGGIKQAGAGNPPVNDSYADPGSALGAATAILFGLWGRQRAGIAQAMETTMLVSTGYIHSADMVVTDPPQPFPVADHEQRGLASTYRLYRCATGHVFVAAVQPAERAALLDVVGRPDLVGRPDHELVAELEAAFAGAPAAEWVASLQAAGVGVAEAYPEQFDHWLEAHDLLLPVHHPAFGDYWRIGPKVDFSGSAPVLAPACVAGEHSCDLLAELGLDQVTIDRLIAEGVTSDGRRKPHD
jgi:crotonobetainyl-CoA:carnitine CoA-transferase CaiB-like acyl-CoA transferase